MNEKPPAAPTIHSDRTTGTSSSAALLTQEHLLPFLLNPKSYAHRPRRVRLVQTHASFVALAPPFVFKVKKAVNFGFLDFSTLKKRRYFCAREVSLNRRLTSKVYLGVVPISTRQGRLTFGAGGEVIEYAVKLRLLPERYFLNQLIKRGALASRHLDRVSARLRRFYQSQHPTKSIESWGRIRRLRISTDENFRQLKPFVAESSPNEPAGENRSGESGLDPITLSPAAYKTLRFYTDQYYRHHAQLFASRIRAHRIRDCHGDLHLDHIHLTPRALNIYDCIEFNDRLRYVDVANDAAFLAMDLDFQGRPDLARHFADRMAKELKDDGMPILMDFYKCYRAVVRGKVESLHSVSHSSSKRERRSATKTARRYFQLALQYAVAGSRPSILAVSGRIGTGKSTLARALGTELGWPVMSSDTIRKRLAGVPLHHRGSPAARNRLYSSEMTERTYTRLLSMAEAKLLKSRGVILDATFGKREQRELLAEHSRNRGIAWTILEAQASDAVVRRRLRARDSMAGVVSDARIDDFKKLTEHYEPPHEVPKGCLAKVRTTGRIDQTVVQALRNLACLRISAAGS